jgi:dihydropteroate synthase
MYLLHSFGEGLWRVCRDISAIPGCVMSVDTFYSEVARAAVDAGAHIVNDISGGRADRDMMSTVRTRLMRVLLHADDLVRPIGQACHSSTMLARAPSSA